MNQLQWLPLCCKVLSANPPTFQLLSSTNGVLSNRGYLIMRPGLMFQKFLQPFQTMCHPQTFKNIIRCCLQTLFPVYLYSSVRYQYANIYKSLSTRQPSIAFYKCLILSQTKCRHPAVMSIISISCTCIMQVFGLQFGCFLVFNLDLVSYMEMPLLDGADLAKL